MSGHSEHVRKQVGRLAQWLLCMSHNESYFGEPAGLVKSVTEELVHAVDPIYPPIEFPADPLAGVTIHTATIPRERDRLLDALGGIVRSNGGQP